MKLDPAAPPSGTVRDWLNWRADTEGARVSHVFPNEKSLTWRELRAAACTFAGRLTRLGLAKSESVALMSPNSRDAIIALFGALYGGFRATQINLAAGASAIGYALSHCDARYAFVAPCQRDLFAQACAAEGVSVAILDAPTGAAQDADAAANPSAKAAFADDRAAFADSFADNADHLHPLIADDPALLMYTSGTTGRPKGVAHSHASLLAGGWTTALAHQLTPDDRALCVLPICHINGLCVTIIGPLVSGGSVVVCPKFSSSRFWGWCAEHHATWFSAVPTIISHLLHGEITPDAQTRVRLRFGRSASAALAPETHSAFESRFGLPLIETMGLTETAAQILSNPLPPGERKIGSSGVAFGNDIAILSPDFKVLDAGVEGEIAVRGPNVMREYLKNPEATAATFTPDGWLRTGDLGRMDADGYVYVTGRLKELIIKGGENIAPREIDDALYAHPDVVEAAAFARPCAKYGERVEAAVALTSGALTTPDALIALCVERLGAFKSPDAVHVMAELPKGPSGKIQRLKLAQTLQS